MSISSRRLQRTQKQQGSGPTIQPGAVSVSVNGSSITVTGVLTTTQSTTFDGLNISVARNETGYPWVFSTALSNGQTVNGTYTLNGSRSGIADGNYVAYISYSLDGQTTWTTGPRAAFEIGTVTAPVPGRPTDLAVTSSTTNSIGLSWTAPAGVVTGYNIYRNGTLITSTPVTSTTYTDNGLTQATSYTYEVKAVNSSGEGDGATLSTATETSNPGTIYPEPVTVSFDGANILFSGALTTTQPTSLRVNISIAKDESGYPWVKSIASVNDGTVNGTLQLSESTTLALGDFVAYVSYSTDGGSNWTIGTHVQRLPSHRRYQLAVPPHQSSLFTARYGTTIHLSSKFPQTPPKSVFHSSSQIL